MRRGGFKKLRGQNTKIIKKCSTTGTQYVLQMVSNHDFWLVANRLSRDELSNCLSNCRDPGGNILNFKKSNRSTDSSTDRFEMRGHPNRSVMRPAKCEGFFSVPAIILFF